MKNRSWIIAAMLVAVLPLSAMSQEKDAVSGKFQALRCPAPSAGSTWTILDRNGANVKVDPYLSSLGEGEGGTGVITSPPFVIAAEKITFTICGHDSQAGGRGENYIALVDARKGEVLLKSPPPQNDALKELSWDVRKFRGTEVRIEVRDGNAGGGYAWLGVGRIEAGTALKVDFRQGMPENWGRSANKAEIRYEVIAGQVPFKRNANAFSVISTNGPVEIPCGFKADRLYFLGCTVSGGKPAETYGTVEIHYRNGPPDVVTLMCGFTLDGTHKLLSPSKTLYLHPSGDPYQYYLAIRPRGEVIDNIRLTAKSVAGPIPRITAITCETKAESERLMALPKTRLETEESTWFDAHSISADSVDLSRITKEILKAHKLPT